MCSWLHTESRVFDVWQDQPCEYARFGGKKFFFLRQALQWSRNLSKNLEGISGHYSKATRNQRKIFSSLAWVILDNRISLAHLLIGKGGVYDIANASCCPWVNTSQQVKLETAKLLKLGTSSRGHLSFTQNGLTWKVSDFFSWLPSGPGSHLCSGLQIILLITKLICPLFITFK